MQKLAKSRSSKPLSIKEKRKLRILLSIPAFALLAQLLIIIRIEGFNWTSTSSSLNVGLDYLLNEMLLPPNAWLGADGENYLRGLWGLVVEGFYSNEERLLYWPAGYSLFLWSIFLVFKGNFFFALSVIQSFVYAIACAVFVAEVYRTRLRKFAVLIALTFAFNPTLILNAPAIGYEVPVFAFILISVALFLRFSRLQITRIFSWESLLASISLFFATLMQPRIIVIALVILAIWGFLHYKKAIAILFITVNMLVVSVGPLIMVHRNQIANDMSTISTNLGVTMSIGAGPESNGGYQKSIKAIECPDAESSNNPSESDRARVKCVLDWYLQNPVKSLQLFWNKAIFFWSPWYGPEANGTMARNPWKLNHPLNSIISSETGFRLVAGPIGTSISWLWIFAGLFLIGLGGKHLWDLGGIERALGVTSISVVMVNMLTSMVTIGDHRFRIPTMGLSLTLQVVGLFALSKNRSTSR